MTFRNTISIIHTQTGLRQVKFTGIAIGEYETVEEAKEFVMKQDYGTYVEIWDGENKVEEFKKIISL